MSDRASSVFVSITMAIALSALVATFISAANLPVRTVTPSAIVVQYRADGTPAYCWQVRSGKPELDLHTPHNAAVVTGDDFGAAARSLGVELDHCNGKYAPKDTLLRTLRPGERP